ncbi:hypothetical protein [Seonamhaeicola sp.]|uniref:hypothetical protein n=1 Tax=Seonamhaeicola sp. TaxID=1912245 RepID=UPI002614D05F|nr:hypothetical protein [Seonamhaeicola sp.]
MQKLIYDTEKEADDKMEVYASLLIEYPSAIYVGVFKEGDMFEIKVGSEDGKYIDRKELIEYLMNNSGGQDSRFSFVESVQKNKSYLEELFDFEILKTYETRKFTLIDPYDETEEILPSKSLKSGLHIGNKERSGGTLGAVFQLEGFPNEYFGISNWHVLAYDIELGGDIVQPGKDNYDSYKPLEKYKCGRLFWRCLDKRREVAFVHFNNFDRFDKHHIENRENYCGIKLSGNLRDVPPIGKKLNKCNYLNSSNNEVLSRNATVKVEDTRFYSVGRESFKIFKNQILLKNELESGNSGSVLTFKEDNNIGAVGLLFCKTEDYKMSVANNLSHIFNTCFDDFHPDYREIYYKAKIPMITKFTPKIIF